MSDADLSRAEILKQIAETEAKLKELHEVLPSAFKNFYRFRMVAPAQSSVFVYAKNRQEADLKVAGRLRQEYPGGYQLHPVVDEYADPQEANNNSGMGTSVLERLMPTDAAEFVRHYRENAKFGRADRRHSQLDRDVDGWEYRQRQIEANQPRRQKVATSFAPVNG